MAEDTANNRQRVAIVTGGGGGIGAAIAEELGRTGAFVVTMDPLVSVDGAEQLPSPEETTAARIVAAGGSARASSASVTDRDGVRSLFAEVADEFGGLDAVVNVAGITRPTSFTRGSEEDWRSVLSVHLDGYRNVLDAALPIMAACGTGARSRRDLRLRVATGRHRRLRLRQTGGGVPHVADGSPWASRRRRERHLAHRDDADRHRRAGPPATGECTRRGILGHRWSLARLHARARATRAAGRTPGE